MNTLNEFKEHGKCPDDATVHAAFKMEGMECLGGSVG